VLYPNHEAQATITIVQDRRSGHLYLISGPTADRAGGMASSWPRRLFQWQGLVEHQTARGRKVAGKTGQRPPEMICAPPYLPRFRAGRPRANRSGAR